TEEPRPIGKVNIALNATVSKVLARALAKRRDERFPSVSDFIGALSIALAEGPAVPMETIAVPFAKTTPARDESPRNSKKLALVVVLCFAVAAAIVFIARLNSGSPVPVQVLETR